MGRSTWAIDSKFEVFTGMFFSLCRSIGPHVERGVPDAKPDGSYVTVQDLKNEARVLIMAGDPAFWPGMPVVSEETFPNLRRFARYWSFDPLDGTTDFLRGKPWWSISIAMLSGGRGGGPIAGVVGQPELRRCFRAGFGGLSEVREFDDGRTWRLIEQKTPRDLIVGTDFGAHSPPRYLEEVERARKAFGAPEINMPAVHGAIEVMLGNVAIYWSHTFHHWDVAATTFLARAAGCEVGAIYGGKYVSFSESTKMQPMYFARSPEIAQMFLPVIRGD